MFSDIRYPTLAQTPSDWGEMPSQFNEHWALDPKVFANYAKNYKTGELMPQSLVDKVKKLGYPAFAEATEYQGKAAQRVRVGPYADRAAAESVRLKIKQADDKVPSSVVDVGDKPVSTADASPAAVPAQTPAANRAGGFAVQVGAFKSEEEANKLRDRMRAGGVASFVEKGAVGEVTWWKVRAGPYADKPGAEAALTSIKQKFQINGMVTAQP